MRVERWLVAACALLSWSCSGCVAPQPPYQQIGITATPAETAITIDGVPSHLGWVSLRADQNHEVNASAPGYESETALLRTDNDRSATYGAKCPPDLFETAAAADAESPLSFGDQPRSVYHLTPDHVDFKLKPSAPPATPPGEAPRPAPQPAPAPAPAVASQAGGTFVLIVGVNDYQDPKIPALRYAEADARLVYRFYASERKSPTGQDRVLLLLGKDATRLKVLRAIREHLAAKATSPEDTAILYFAGHGFADARDSYLGGPDTDLTMLPETSISGATLRDYWAEIRCGHKLLITDACHSGGIEGLRGIGGVSFAPAKTAETGATLTVSIAASGANEVSAEDPKLGGGVFTAALLNGLHGDADENGDGRVTAEELARYLMKQVPALAAQAGAKQTPVIQGAESGSRFYLTR